MPRPPSDREFEKMIHEHQSLIIKVCNMYSRTYEDQDDLFQDIVLKLWKGISSFQGHAKLSTWIYKVSLNTAISYHSRRSKIRLVFPERIPETGGISREGTQETSGMVRILHVGIKQLKPVERAIILLYLEEKSYEEIAEIIGISLKNVSVKLVRIKRKLKKIMETLITHSD